MPKDEKRKDQVELAYKNTRNALDENVEHLSPPEYLDVLYRLDSELKGRIEATEQEVEEAEENGQDEEDAAAHAAEGE